MLQTTFAFIDFELGKEYIFKVEYEKSRIIRNNATTDDVELTTIKAQMTVKRSSDNWLNFHLSKIKKNKDGDDGLDMEFKAKIEKGKMVDFDDSSVATSYDTDFIETVIKELVKDHGDIIRLPYTEVTDDDVTVEMPMGTCKITKLNLKTEEKEHVRTISAKSNIHDCILSERTLKKLKKITQADLTNDSFNKVSLIFDTRTNHQIGVKSSSELAVNKDDLVATAVQSVFINFIDAKDTSDE